MSHLACIYFSARRAELATANSSGALTNEARLGLWGGLGLLLVVAAASTVSKPDRTDVTTFTMHDGNSDADSKLQLLAPESLVIQLDTLMNRLNMAR
jgi:hypothetical protein